MIVDNYDSFVYNLVQYCLELRFDVNVARNDEVTARDIVSFRPSAIVLSPGPCTPREAGISTDLVARYGPEIPILGVCLGHQCIAEAFGGRVVRARQVVHGKASLIEHDGRGVYEGLENPLLATRYHSLVVDPYSLPSDLVATAWTSDGVLMGIRHRRHPVEGVQFHPESILTRSGHNLLSNFLTGSGVGAGV